MMKKCSKKSLHIRWREKNDGNVHAFNNSGEWLGYLRCELVGRHKHWCWYQTHGIRMSPGCLEEVRDEQKVLFKERRRLKHDEKTS